jgi:hypothetical protein
MHFVFILAIPAMEILLANVKHVWAQTNQHEASRLPGARTNCTATLGRSYRYKVVKVSKLGGKGKRKPISRKKQAGDLGRMTFCPFFHLSKAISWSMVVLCKAPATGSACALPETLTQCLWIIELKVIERSWYGTAQATRTSNGFGELRRLYALVRRVQAGAAHPLVKPCAVRSLSTRLAPREQD